MKTHLYASLSCAALLTLALAGCGSSASVGSSSSTTAASGVSSTSASGRGGSGGNRPGTSGLIAAIDGRTLQVQNTSEQVAVTYTSSTKISDEAKVAASTLKVGDCVSARPARSSAPASGSPTAGPTQSSTVAATTVQIISTSGAACTTGFRGGAGRFGGRPSDAPTDAAGQATSGDASGGSTGRGRGVGGGGFGGIGFGATGAVTAVSDGSFTVKALSFGGSRQGSSSARPSPTTRNVIVTYTGSTTFTARRTATASAIKTGLCVTALGKADDTGAVTASSLALRTAVDGSCTGGFGRG